MKKRFIGNIEVSKIGMGCMGFSHGYGQIPTEEYSIEAIRRAYDEAGCTFFDTAEGYGGTLYYPGHNEQILGKAVKDVRQQIVLATKLHLSPDEVSSVGSVYEATRKHLEQSMKNLQTDYVDLYYLHRVNEEVPFEEVANAMGRLIQDGVIRGWGMSQVGVETLRSAHEITPVTAVQNLYSMVERDCEKELIPFCETNNIGLVPFSPIASGLLSGKITTDTQFEQKDDVRNFVPQLTKENIAGNQPIINLLQEVAASKNATPAQISLAWMLAKYPHVVPIPGSKNQERIMENLEAANVILSDDELASLDKALDQFAVFGHRGIEETEQHGFGQTIKGAIPSRQ